MITAVDTSVLLDVFLADGRYGEQSPATGHALHRRILGPRTLLDNRSRDGGENGDSRKVERTDP